MNDSTEPDVQASFLLARRLRTFGLWVRKHWIRTILCILLVYIFIEFLTIPYFDIARLRSENPMETALMRQRIVEAGDQGKSLKISRQWIPLSRIPRHALDAIIVAEDGTFYSHGGFDWFEIQESIERNLEEGRAARGASTITQQLAKNLYLSTSKTPLRKLKEVVITFLLENQLGKNRILELYVNLIEWGRGIFGIDAAAKTYFGKSASELTLDEAARLAAVIPSPLAHRPDSNSKYVLRRKQIVLSRMTARKIGTPSTNEEVQPDAERQKQLSEEGQPETTGTIELSDSIEIPDSSEGE